MGHLLSSTLSYVYFFNDLTVKTFSHAAVNNSNIDLYSLLELPEVYCEEFLPIKQKCRCIFRFLNQILYVYYDAEI